MRFNKRVLPVAALVSRFGLATLFIYAVVAALSSPYEFVSYMSSLVVGGRGAIYVSIAVILAEATAAILLMIPRTARLGGYWTAVLLMSFTIYPLYHQHIFGGGSFECKCFGGIIASQRGIFIAVRNLLLLLPTAIVIASSYRPVRRRTKEHQS
jgi:uncharacterized membrane protein YphA (DoxX/SURF4 family)